MTMTDMLMKLAEGLITTSPLVGLLSYALWTVWKAYRDLQADFIAFLKGVADEKGSANHGTGERS